MGVLDFFKGEKRDATYLQYGAKARLYRYRDTFFVTSVAEISEYDDPTKLATDCSDNELGAAALLHLSQYREERIEGSRSKNLTDWRVYQVSGAKSVRAFEKEAWHVDLALMNSAVLIWARPRLSLETHLSAYGDCNRHDPDMVGVTIRKTLAAAEILRSNSVI